MDTQTIKTSINIIAYYERHLQFTYRHGKNWKALCPFHSEKDGSFSVNVEDGLWHCFGCDNQGDIIQFQQKIANQTFEQALEELAREAGVEVPTPPREKNKEKVKRHPDLTEEAVQELVKALPDFAKQYLVGRAIPEKTIQQARVGWWNDYLVFPVFKRKKIFTYRFRSIRDKSIWQLSAKEIGASPVWLWPEPDFSKPVLLCEGETDALTALAMGFNACTITGGAGTWNDELEEAFKGSVVTVCYDIDKKGEIGARHVAQQLVRIAKEVRIVHLDLDIEKYPTGDLNDYFSKECKKIEDLDALISKADIATKTPEGCRVIEYKSAYYRKVPGKKNDFIFTKISNFVLRLYCNVINLDYTMSRFIHIVSDQGKISPLLVISGDQLSSDKKFKSFCASSGNYLFEGSESDLNDVCHLLFGQEANKKEISVIAGVGYSKSEKMWILDNLCIKNGSVYPKDADGVYWNGSKGYCINSFEKAKEKFKQYPIIPPTEETLDETRQKIKEFVGLLATNTGTLDSVYGVALALGSLYFHEIQEKYGCFPLLWVYGRLQCGKNEYCRFLMNLFGMGRQNNENLAALTSTVPVTRLLSFYSGIPVWFDEFRTTLRNVENLYGTLRGAYQASGRTLGLKGGGITSEHFSAPVIISGEELPTDEALMSRVVTVQLSRAKRHDEYYYQVVDKSHECSAHIFNLIKTKNDESVSRLFDSIEKFWQKTKKTNTDSRRSLNHAIVLASYEQFIDPDDTILESYLSNSMTSNESWNENLRYNQTDLLVQFIEEMSVIIADSKLLGNITWYAIEEDRVYIWLRALYDKWLFTKKTVPVGYQTLVDQFRETNYVLSTRTQKKIFDHNSMRCHNRKCISMKIKDIPVEMRQWFSLDD